MICLAEYALAVDTYCTCIAGTLSVLATDNNKFAPAEFLGNPRHLVRCDTLEITAVSIDDRIIIGVSAIPIVTTAGVADNADLVVISNTYNNVARICRVPALAKAFAPACGRLPRGYIHR